VDFSQVGLVLEGTIIESTIVGGPAHTSMRLGRGDILLEVDGEEATDQNIGDLLVGNDRPGSRLVLTVAKAGSEVFCFVHASLSALFVLTLRILGPCCKSTLDSDGLCGYQRTAARVRTF
jgi:hypothetical protein